MNAYEKIKKACAVLGVPAYPDDFSRSDTRYITYNTLEEHGANFGDDKPGAVVGTYQVHLFLPRDENFFPAKVLLRTALFDQGFTFPDITYNGVETGTDTRHIVFEFEDDDEDFTL